MLAVIVPTVWKSFPFFAITILAALQGIPGSLYEAAKVDGATAWQQFRHVTWPGIKRPAMLAVVLNALWTFREFDIIYASTGGGPAGATETLGILVYREAFGSFRFGTAAALGVLMLVTAAIFVVVAMRSLKDEFRSDGVDAPLAPVRAGLRGRRGRAVPDLLDVRHQRAAVVDGALAPAAARAAARRDELRRLRRGVPPAAGVHLARQQHDRRGRIGVGEPRHLDARRLLAVALPHAGAARGRCDPAAVEDAAGEPHRHPVLRDVHDGRDDRQPAGGSCSRTSRSACPSRPG